MKQEDIEQQIKNILSEHLEVEPPLLLPDTRLVEDLAAASLDMVEILIALERTFNIFIKDDEAHRLHTVSDVVALVQQKLAV